MAFNEETETLTIRLPKGLKGLVEDTAKLRSTSVTAIVRESLMSALQPAGTIVQSPGMTAAFQDFIDKHNHRGARLLLLVTTGNGARYFFDGHIEHTLTNPSVVTMVAGQQQWVIPRHEVVGWFGGNSSATLDHLVQALVRQGWAPR